MKKNQIIIEREFFKHITNNGNSPAYSYVVGRKNNKVIKFSWMYTISFTMHIDKFIEKIKEKYENIEGLSDKEIIDNAQQIWKEEL